MGFSEADTRAKLIDPALHARGWTEELIRREETSGAIDVVDGVARKRSRGRIDYTLRVRVNPNTQPVALALVEAKAESLPPDYGLVRDKERLCAFRIEPETHAPFVSSPEIIGCWDFRQRPQLRGQAGEPVVFDEEVTVRREHELDVQPLARAVQLALLHVASSSALTGFSYHLSTLKNFVGIARSRAISSWRHSVRVQRRQAVPV